MSFNGLFLFLVGVDTEEPFEENNKKLLVKVGEYLKSDCHMYAPLVLDQPSLSTDNSEVNPQTGTYSFLHDSIFPCINSNATVSWALE